MKMELEDEVHRMGGEIVRHEDRLRVLEINYAEIKRDTEYIKKKIDGELIADVRAIARSITEIMPEIAHYKSIKEKVFFILLLFAIFGAGAIFLSIKGLASFFPNGRLP